MRYDSLPALVRNSAERFGSQPAIVSGQVTLTFGELWARMEAVAGGIQRLDYGVPALAVSEREPLETLVLVLGCLLAGKQVLLLDPDASAERLASHTAEAEARLLLTASDPGHAAQASGIELLWQRRLPAGPAASPSRMGLPIETALLVPVDEAVVIHSHLSVSAMATSLTTFIPQLREAPCLCLGRLWQWENLVSTLISLSQGQAVLFASLADLDGRRPLDLSTGYAILCRQDADEVLEAGRAPPILSGLRYLFVSTGHFTLRWRRRLEGLLGRPILPIWGSWEVGPIVAAHPTWFPIRSHGIPLVNVVVSPIDPGTGQVSQVPWEMLERAEMGVETLSAMLGYTQATRLEQALVGRIYRTRQMVAIDHVGVVTLQPPWEPADGDGG